MVTAQIEWADGRVVDAVIDGSGRDTIVLAHGAGAGQSHPFMVGMRERLGRHHRVVSFDYPYMAEGRRAPDRLPVLLECHRAVVGFARDGARRVFLGGKSMGGRVGSHLDMPSIAGRFYLGYPLVPIGTTEPRDTTHLDTLRSPMLFVQGERDRMGPPDLIGAIAARLERAELVVVSDADHGFKVPKRSGLDEAGVLDRLGEIVLGWLAGL